MKRKVVWHTHYALKAVMLVPSHLIGPISAKALAPEVGIHPQTLVRCLRMNLRLSLTVFRQKYRMHMMARMIEYSPKSMVIGNILPVVGIGHINTANRLFRQEFGVSLGTYQKEHGGTKTIPAKITIADLVLKDMCVQYFK